MAEIEDSMNDAQKAAYQRLKDADGQPVHLQSATGDALVRMGVAVQDRNADVVPEKGLVAYRLAGGGEAARPQYGI